jgi:membrane-bound acyltransferase YfiQ involved in biofilm formation
MSVFVVVWHMGGGGWSTIFYEDEYLKHVFTVSDFLNFHILLLSVPTFIFISIFLYASKPISIQYFIKRLSRITILLSFWPIAFILCDKGYQGLLAIVPTSSIHSVYIVLNAGNTIYYFFTSLIICLFVSHLILYMNLKFQLSLFFISIVFLASLPQLTMITSFYPLSACWNPLNFIPFTFAAVILAQNMDFILGKSKVIVLLSIVLCVFFSIIEWKYYVGEIFFPGQGCGIPIYTRTSLLFAVFALFTLALRPEIKANVVIKFMARYSLALYCLHPFLIGLVKRFVAALIQNDTVGLYLSIILVILLSYSIGVLLRKYYFRKGVIM